MDDLSIKSAVIDALMNVNDPQSGKSIVDAHILDGVEVQDGKVTLKLQFSENYPRESRWTLEDAAADAVEAVEGVKEANILAHQAGENPYGSAGTPAAAPAAKPAAKQEAKHNHDHGHSHDQGGIGAGAAAQTKRIEGVGRVIAVASGKGGVGKSTVAVNLALALQKLGFRVGLLDIDIYGPSVPTLLGINERPNVKNKRIVPLEKYNLRLMSLGFLMEDDSPVIWRGPIVTGIVRQFLQDVDWTGLDYLIIDMPPGTGDAQLSLAQSVPVDGAVVVTTPSDLALVDAARGLRMFQTLNVDVIGIVENMSWYVWGGQRETRALVDELRSSNPALAARFDDVLARNERAYIFGRDGGAREAERLETRFLGHIPLDGEVRSAGDGGKPIVVSNPESPTTDAFMDLARAVAEARPVGDGGGEGAKGIFSFMKK